MKRVIMGLFWVVAFTVRAEVTVQNVVATQLKGTKTVQITYDVSSTYTNTVTVSLIVNNDLQILASSGDIGGGVKTGTGKSILWDGGTGWGGNMETLTVIVTCDDHEAPEGGDKNAIIWEIINDRWIKNTYANGDVTMSDGVNNNMWLYSANTSDLINWYDATDFCEDLTYASHSDWKLPDIDMLEDQYGQKGLFIVLSQYYWSSTRNYQMVPGPYYYVKSMGAGATKTVPSSSDYHAWPVRSISMDIPEASKGSSTFDADFRSYELGISTEKGVTVPAEGIYTNYCWQSVITCSVEQVEVGNEWFAGWAGTVETNHTGNPIIITLTNISTSVAALYSGDVDGDGIVNTNEATYGTDPWLSDTDNDGLDDYQEVVTYETDPLDSDMDDDGLTDTQEVLTYGTNPVKADSDGDDFGDRYEINTGYNPLSSNSTPDTVMEIMMAVEIVFHAADSINYRIEGTDDLSGSWEEVESGIDGSGGLVSRLYSTSIHSNRYFRAVRE